MTDATAGFYDDVVFPRSISLAAFKGKVGRSSRRFTTQGGDESRIALWASSLRSYDAGLVPRTATEWQLITDLFEVVFGPVFGFLLHDETDFRVVRGRGAFVATGNPLEFAFQKRYLVGTRAVYRGIAKPKTFPVPVLTSSVGGAVPVVIDPATYAIDYANGRVLFNASSPALSGDLGWVGEHWTPVHFDTDELDWNSASRSVVELYIEAPSVPIKELRWRGMPLRVPDTYVSPGAATPAPAPGPSPAPAPGASVVPLTSGSPLYGYNGSAGTALVFSAAVGAAATDLQAIAAPGTGTVTIYLKLGAVATAASHDAASSTGTGYVTVDFPSPAAGTWYMTIVCETDVTNLALLANVAAPPAASQVVIGGGSRQSHVGVASLPFTFALDGLPSSPVHVTLGDAGGGGTWSPASLTLAAASDSLTATYTPATAGPKTLVVANDASLADPASVVYAAVTSGGPAALAAPPIYGTLSNGNRTLANGNAAYSKADALSTCAALFDGAGVPSAGRAAEFTVQCNPASTGNLGIAVVTAAGTNDCHYFADDGYGGGPNWFVTDVVAGGYANPGAANAGGAWANGDKIGLIVYTDNDAPNACRVAFFRNGALVGSGLAKAYPPYPPYYFEVFASTYGTAALAQMSVVTDIAAMTYGSTYQAFRDSAVRMLDAGSWVS